jgi:hypothetical protein
MNPHSRYYMSWSDLHFAASAGDVERVRELLKKGVDPNAKNEYGWTPLHVAALKGRVDVVKLLLERGADPNAKNGDGKTPLHVAAIRGSVDVARLLLEHGADPNAQDKHGNTPLHDAVFEGHVGIVKLLLDHGADPTAKNKDGDTPLDLARRRGHRKVVSLIQMFHIEGWLGRGGEPSRPGAALVRSASDAVCEACCEAWSILSQLSASVKDHPLKITAKDAEDLEHLFNLFKGHLDGLATTVIQAAPDAVKELVDFRKFIELILPQLKQGNPPPETISTIITMYHRINNLKQQLACRC